MQDFIHSLVLLASILAVIFITVSGLEAPEFVRFGGLFPSFKMNGQVSSSGSQRLAGFLMAIDEINVNMTLLPNTTILFAVRDTHLNVGKTFFATLDLAEKSFSGAGVDGCIGPATSSETDAAATVLNQFQTAQIGYSATSPLLSSKINYPLFARTCPSDAFQGAAMADMVYNYYGWKTVATFANSDTYGANGISQFQSSATGYGVQILSSSLFPVGQTNFAVPIADALKGGARVFVFIMTATDMGNLIEQGYAAGLFHEGTQIIVADASAVPAVWAQIPKALVSTVMKGVFAFAPSPDYSSPTGARFLKNFIKLPNTIKDPITGLCNNRMDNGSRTSPYLYKEALNPLAPNVYNCSGVNFTKFKSDGSNIDDYASYTYDATYAMAYAMHDVLYKQKLGKITGKTLFHALINNVSFVGASGAVNFSHALTSDSTRFAEGDRRNGVIYKVLNFQPDAYAADPTGTSGYVQVGTWTQENGIRLSGVAVTYNTADGLPPSDLPPIIILTMSPVLVSLLKALGAVLLAFTFIFTATIIVLHKTKLVKAIQIRMQLFGMLGAFLGGARVITGSLPVTDANCSANVWLGHLAVWFIFCPMMLKTWRVHKIVNNKTFKRVTVTEKYIMRLFLVAISVVMVYLAIIQGLKIATPIKITVVTVVGIQTYHDDQCSRKDFGFEIFLFVAEAVLLIITAALCQVTKHIPGALNEANNNLKALVIVTCAAVVAFPISYALKSLDGGTKQATATLGIFVAGFSTICIGHGWRTILLVGGYDIDQDHQLKRKMSTQPHKVTDVARTTSKESQRRMSHSPSASDLFGGSSDINPFEAVKTKNLLNRRKTCREQIEHWSSVLRNTEMMMLMQADEKKCLVTGKETPNDRYKSPDIQCGRDPSVLFSLNEGNEVIPTDLLEMKSNVE